MRLQEGGRYLGTFHRHRPGPDNLWKSLEHLAASRAVRAISCARHCWSCGLKRARFGYVGAGSFLRILRTRSYRASSPGLPRGHLWSNRLDLEQERKLAAACPDADLAARNSVCFCASYSHQCGVCTAIQSARCYCIPACQPRSAPVVPRGIALYPGLLVV